MARIQALSLIDSEGAKEYLAELYGKVIENIQKNTISAQIKNTALSGTPTSGTVEAKRFANATSKAYGTARAAGKGDAVVADPITIAINVDKEIIHEVEEKDVSLYGVDSFVQREIAMDQKAMARELEKAFWTEAKTAGTNHATLTATTAEGQAEELIQLVETVSNDYVDGVERDMINLVVTPAFYGKLRTYIDKVNDGGAKGEEISLFHGVKIFSSTYLPSGVKTGVAIADGSIAQPVLPTVAQPTSVQLSNAKAFGIFYSYGTKAVAEDLIFWN